MDSHRVIVTLNNILLFHKVLSSVTAAYSDCFLCLLKAQLSLMSPKHNTIRFDTQVSPFSSRNRGVWQDSFEFVHIVTVCKWNYINPSDNCLVWYIIPFQVLIIYKTLCLEQCPLKTENMAFNRIHFFL